MSRSSGTELQWKAAFAAALLLAIGAFIGVCVDRIWLVAFAEDHRDSQVTIAALSEALSLSMGERDRLAALLDSIGMDMRDAIENHPDSLRSVARDARTRLEHAVPPDRRQGFRRWMDGRRSEMLDRMRRGDMRRHRGGRGRGWTPDNEPRGRGRGQPPR